MAPPELTADAPVADTAHPMRIGFCPAIGVKFNCAGFDGFGGTGNLRVPEEPLLAEVRLDGYIGALAVADVVSVVLHFDEETGEFKLFDDGFPAFKPVETFVIFAGGCGHDSVRTDDDGERQLVPQRHLVVGEVVCRCDFDAAGAELWVNGGIGDDWNFFIPEWEKKFFPDEMLITRVVGIYCDSFVSEKCFGARGGDNDIVAIPDVPEMTLRLGHNDFFVGERSAAGGIPVHHAFAAIDETFFVKVNEGLEDGVAKLFVHRETFARPVAGATEFLQLLDDDAAVFVFPFPNFFLKFFAAKVIAMFDNALFLERFLDDGLGGDAGVVGAGEPEDFVALHPFPAGENVLERIVEHVAHGEDAGHIWRRNNDGVGGFRRSRARGEVAVA